jgi:hypothetical protein
MSCQPADPLAGVVDQPVMPTPATSADLLIGITDQPAVMIRSSLCTHERDTAGRYCRSCRARYMREWRKKQREIVVKLKAEYGLGRIVSRETNEA